MILLDIAAPILLMLGLKSASSANASLLGNFEIAATTLIALLLFREKVSKRLWAAILLITLSSGILSFEDMSSLHFSRGSLLVLAAAACWGLENNCTRNNSDKSTFEIRTPSEPPRPVPTMPSPPLSARHFPASSGTMP